MRFSEWSLRAKLVGGFLVIGMVPALVLGWSAWSTTSRMGERVGPTYETTAHSINDLIDRNLFERYGDVQAFGMNEVLRKKDDWYKVGSEQNAVTDAANDYIALYCIYDLVMVVDLDGRLIAVNDLDPSGKPIDTAWMYRENFKDESWFQDALAGKYLESSVLSGTVVSDLCVDECVKRSCGGDGLGLGYSAPWKDEHGKVGGVWHNVAKFSLVEEIVQTVENGLNQQGLSDTQITLLSRDGDLLLDYFPAQQGRGEVRHDMSALLRRNLVSEGFEAARALSTAKAGHGRSKDSERGVWQVTGYARSVGALGYPGLGWGVLVRVDETKALAEIWAIRLQVVAVLVCSILGFVVAAWLMARSLARPIQQNVDSINHSAEDVSTVAEQVAVASQFLAQASTENAASLEETSASMSEMNSMTQRNAENASEAASCMTEVHAQVDQSRKALESMISAMKAIGESSTKVSRIIKTIDEIAFQTNILALNAAVEAARAGEAGKGFAVVADEVRSLAQRSAEAARSTSALIEESIQNSEQGGKQLDQVTSAIGGISGSVDRVQILVEGVSMASRQQSQSFVHISSAVSQMEKVTQNIAASAEESAAAGQELTSHARNARIQVSQLLAVIGGADTVSKLAEPPPAPARRGSGPLSLVPRPRPAPKVPSKARRLDADDHDDDFFAQTGTDL